MDPILASLLTGGVSLGVGIFATWLKMTRNGNGRQTPCPAHAGIVQRFVEGERRFGDLEDSMRAHTEGLGEIKTSIARLDEKVTWLVKPRGYEGTG